MSRRAAGLAATIAGLLLVAAGVSYASIAGGAASATCTADSYDGATLTLHCAVPQVTVTATATVTATVTPSNPTPTPTPTSTTPAAAWPGPSNTGVPAGVVLHTCPATITTAGTYDSCSITGGLTVKASGVTITRSLIKGGVDADTGQTGLSITDSTLDCGCLSTSANSSPAGISGPNFTLTRVNLEHSAHGAAIDGNVTIRDSWIHALGGNTAAHKDGIYAGDGSNVLIQHNVIDCNDGPVAGCTSAVGLLDDFTPMTHWTIDGNLLNTIGSYCLYAGGGPQKPYRSSYITVTNNHFGRADNARCGFYGPVTYFDQSQPGMVWSGNVWDDTGATVDPVN